MSVRDDRVKHSALCSSKYANTTLNHKVSGVFKRKLKGIKDYCINNTEVYIACFVILALLYFLHYAGACFCMPPHTAGLVVLYVLFSK